MYTICVLVFIIHSRESMYLKIKKYKALNYSYKWLPQIIIFFKKTRQTLSTLGKKKTLYQDCPNSGWATN